MPTGGLHLEKQRLAAAFGLHDGDVIDQPRRNEAVIVARLGTKAQHAGGAGCGRRCKNRGDGQAGGNNRHAAGFQPLKHGGLFARDGIKPGERLQMRGGNRGNQRRVRTGEARQRRDFAGVVHADLDHGKVGILRQPRQRQRHPPVVVVACLGGVHIALRCQHRAQHFLARGLADRTGHANHAGPRPRPACAAQFGQRRKHIGHDQKRVSLGTARRNMADERCGSAARQRSGHEIMAIAHVLQGNEQIAPGKVAAVDRNPGGHKGAGCAATGGGGGLIRGPERGHQILPSSAATATLACSASSKG